MRRDDSETAMSHGDAAESHDREHDDVEQPWSGEWPKPTPGLIAKAQAFYDRLLPEEKEIFDTTTSYFQRQQ